jgi:hypothetical protein
MNCSEGSKRVKTLWSELHAIRRWDSLYSEEDAVGRKARAMRTREILQQLALVREEYQLDHPACPEILYIAILLW